VDGMLGGFSKISTVDAQASMRFLSAFFEPRSGKANNNKGDSIAIEPTRALDCGAGIGRVTKQVLLNYFDKVDLLEQSQSFIDKSREYIGEKAFEEQVDNLFCAGLQDFKPKEDCKYDVIWCQWVTGYLTDQDFVTFLVKCKNQLKPNGLIVIKDNHTSSEEPDDDMSDSSVTRPYWQFLKIFRDANLTVACERRQVKFPKGLYPVKMFALR